jgi:hypothetical protein
MPSWVIDIFKDNYVAFVANPILYFLVFVAGAFLGYAFSKLVHKGKIDALEERIKLKADQIELKDKTIQSMSADRTKLEQAAVQSPPAVSSPIEPKRDRTDNRFAAANAQITNSTEQRLRQLLLSGKFNFVFNPTTGGSKQLTFLPNGDIGEGRNNNEHRWRIADGRLEILSADGAVYSRFVLLADNESLHHTNDPDTRSLRGQYIKRYATN